MLEERDTFRRGRVRRSRERSMAMAAEARRRLGTRGERGAGRTASGRVWLNGRELGSPDGRFAHLGASHD